MNKQDILIRRLYWYLNRIILVKEIRQRIDDDKWIPYEEVFDSDDWGDIMSELRKTIERKAQDYLNGNLSFNNFLDWLISETWDINKNSALEDAEELSNKIDALYIQYSEDHITKNEFKSELKTLIKEWFVWK